MIIRLVLFFCCCFGILEGQKVKEKTTVYENCGKRIGKDNNGGTIGVFTTEAGRFPWHVGVYKYDRISDSYENICGGTIIAPHLVLTAAACVYNPANRAAEKPFYFKVAAGKIAYGWSTPDPNAQEIDVNDIFILDTFLGDINSYAENVAVLNLAKDLIFNDLVHPVCFELKDKTHDVPNSIVQTAGWGFKGDVRHSPTLKEANLQYIGITECRKKYSSIRYLRFINYDKICVLTPEGRRDYDTGSGLVYKKGGQYYLLGIISANINNQFSPSTNLSKHLDWIKGTIEEYEKKKRCREGFFKCLDGECIDEFLLCDNIVDCKDGTDEAQAICTGTNPEKAKNGCQLPSQRGGVSYTKQDCNSDCELKGGGYVSQKEKVSMSCGQGFAPKENERSATYACLDTGWFPEDPKCIKLCDPLKKTNLKFKCTHNGQEVRCDTFIRPGTIATYECNQHYRIVDATAFSGFTTCGNGIWSEPLPTCTPECGIENLADSAQVTISYGNISKHGKYPWHVALFRRLDYNQSYVNICGGTLIHEHFILTAAHCMFRANGLKLTEDELMVAGGKFYRSWNKHGQFQQTSRVKNILLQETYAGAQTHYEQDIALLNTEKLFIYTDFVLPACLDYSRRVIFPNYNGTIVGWGLTENNDYVEELKEVHLPVITTTVCRNRYRDFVSFITSDKFCILYNNGTGTQSGDSGGGLTLRRNGLHYVYGIVSVKKTNSNLFAALTNVSVHTEWIRETIRTFSRI